MTEPTHAELPQVDQPHQCQCGHEHGVPELDARVIPHALRHGAILGALSRVPSGGSMVLVAPHNPLPLLDEITRVEEGAIDVSYLTEGPDAWRLQLTRAR